MNTSNKEHLAFANLPLILSDELNGFQIIGSLGILERTLKGWGNIGLNVHAMNCIVSLPSPIHILKP